MKILVEFGAMHDRLQALVPQSLLLNLGAGEQTPIEPSFYSPYNPFAKTQITDFKVFLPNLGEGFRMRANTSLARFSSSSLNKARYRLALVEKGASVSKRLLPGEPSLR